MEQGKLQVTVSKGERAQNIVRKMGVEQKKGKKRDLGHVRGGDEEEKHAGILPGVVQEIELLLAKVLSILLTKQKIKVGYYLWVL